MSAQKPTAQKLAKIETARVPANDLMPQGPAQPLDKRSKARGKAAIGAFQKDTEAIQNAPDPFLARITLHLLALLVIAGILWASLSYLDKIVASQGKIISTEPNVMVQPLEMAAIKQVLVRAGDVVHQGQVLATLDPTFTQADVLQLESRLANADALIARLEAEHDGKPFVPTADRYGYSTLQQALWRERQAQYQSQMQNYEEKLARLQSNVAKYEMDRLHLNERLKVVREIENMRSSLLATQVGSKLNLLQATSDRIDIERNLVLNQNELQGNRHDLQAQLAERDVFIQQWNGKIIEELTTQRNEREALREQLTKARKRQALVQLDAPVDAIVLEVSPKATPGSIAKEAEPLFTLVPVGAPLEVEANIDARDLAFVQVGDKVRVKLDAYPYMQHGSLEGELATISEDSFSSKDNGNGLLFYRARVKLLTTTLDNVPSNFRLIPGMPLTADIKVGERRIITYFLRPILRGFDESLREP
ncbi:HlyD family type I secretion membrane fusion protein [Azospirillum lipoferum]|uniref:Membrane fusion protein (MFP) family protein n=1 Tax=Azospirillum lipoferum TaxID=193 RepID=A0A5A9GH57_AZOLI|nr:MULTISPECIES: HlyD family type I secretion periplasmic adaptor subunit [Azospirillum]KAA0593693.1 HlyD family type I secretion periplasmic adaptor subunit [Azospirillum lipoferum]MCP1615046.1 HlyD family type I secretion membrane fusion protein [Azospirillum lipoferum]MDW5536951.1 HlyD family type I secretion periplasmic adaptor subunit [Azospirillum sp. NL1]